MSNPASNWLNAQPSDERRVLKAIWDRLPKYVDNYRSSIQQFHDSYARFLNTTDWVEISPHNESYQVWVYDDPALGGAGILITTPERNVSYKSPLRKLDRILNNDREEIISLYNDAYPKEIWKEQLTSSMVEDMAMMAAFTVVSTYGFKGLLGRDITHLFPISMKFLNWGDEDPLTSIK